MVRTPTRTRARRSKRRRRIVLRVLLVAVLIAAAAGAAAFVASRPKPAPVAGSVAASSEQFTILVATTVVDDPSQRADVLTLFAVDGSTGEATGLFIPSGVFGTIPGESSVEQVGKALVFGRETLQEITIENLLGIDVDRTVALTDVAVAQMVDALGGVPVSVTTELYETTETGARELVFPLGDQVLDGAEAGTFLTYRAGDESDLDRFVRVQQLWEGLLATMMEAPDRDEAIAGATDLAGSGAMWMGEFLSALDRVDPSALRFDVLPVRGSSTGVPNVFEPDHEAIRDVVGALYAGSLLPGVGATDERPRIDLRNGNGRPGTGSALAQELVPAGFHIVVTGNTVSFDHQTTRIVVYGDDETYLALARRIRDLIGFGRVEIGTRAQTVVDATIVVGKDFTEMQS